MQGTLNIIDWNNEKALFSKTLESIGLYVLCVCVSCGGVSIYTKVDQSGKMTQ